MGGVSPIAHSAKLKIIYGSKTSKTDVLGTISIQIFYSPHVLCIWLVATLKGGGGGGGVPPPPNETLRKLISNSY